MQDTHLILAFGKVVIFDEDKIQMKLEGNAERSWLIFQFDIWHSAGGKKWRVIGINRKHVRFKSNF